ncbi:MAG: hypothetical protein K2P99_07470 [Burkholderiales bacterium]|nr:hypothetical protein [Burkholderiales bacterium]
MKRLNYYRCYLLFIVIGMSIFACGFHLRGMSRTYKFPFSAVYVECKNTVICNEFNNTIKTQGLAKSTIASEADVNITLFNEQTSREAQGFNASGRISKYNLIYQIDAKIMQNHETLGNIIHISVNSMINYSDSLILSANQDEATHWDRLHQNATNQLIRQLVYFKYYTTKNHDESKTL